MKSERSNTDLANAFDETFEDLLHTISSFSQKEFNEVPFTGSWSAAQVADHLKKSLQGTGKTLYGNVRPTERKLDENVEGLKSIFLNFNTKFQSPELILPSENHLEKNLIYQNIKEASEVISKSINTLDLSSTCPVPFPGLGELTRYEWVSLAIYHTQRHIRQMKKIKEHLNTVNAK
jgi:DinB family protein